MNQAEEIVSRNKGNVDDLVNHLNQEIHVSAIMLQRMGEGSNKSYLEAKLIQLQQIKVELQQALIKYQVSEDFKKIG